MSDQTETPDEMNLGPDFDVIFSYLTEKMGRPPSLFDELSGETIESIMNSQEYFRASFSVALLRCLIPEIIDEAIAGLSPVEGEMPEKAVFEDFVERLLVTMEQTIKENLLK